VARLIRPTCVEPPLRRPGVSSTHFIQGNVTAEARRPMALPWIVVRVLTTSRSVAKLLASSTLSID
jgi:hypothetical protein